MDQDNYVIYGINKFIGNDNKSILEGYCIENINDNLEKYLSLQIILANYMTLKNNKYISGMTFNGIIEGYFHSIDIYKSYNSEILIKYMADREEDKKIILKDYSKLPVLNEGNISPEEIQMIIDYLNNKYNNQFINLLTNELMSFSKKIYDKKDESLEKDSKKYVKSINN